MTPIFMRIWLMKMTRQFGACNRSGQLAQCLAHQARLQTDMGIPISPSSSALRHQGGDRINHQNVDRARTHQRIGDLKRLLTGIGLGDQQIVQIDTQLAGIDRIKRVFGIDKGADAACLLGFGHDMQRQGRLAGTFGP